MEIFSQCGFLFSDHCSFVKLIKQTKNKTTTTSHIKQNNFIRDSDMSLDHIKLQYNKLTNMFDMFDESQYLYSLRLCG